MVHPDVFSVVSKKGLSQVLYGLIISIVVLIITTTVLVTPDGWMG